MIHTKIWNPISHILAPPSIDSSQTTFQESLGNITTSVAAATQHTAGDNIGITSSTCMVWRIPQWAIPNVQCHPYLVSFLFIPSLYLSFLIRRSFLFSSQYWVWWSHLTHFPTGLYISYQDLNALATYHSENKKVIIPDRAELCGEFLGFQLLLCVHLCTKQCLWRGRMKIKVEIQTYILSAESCVYYITHRT